MKSICVVAYLPPADRFPTAEFLENIKANPTENKLICFSDSDHDIPDLIKIPNPEPSNPAQKPKKWFTNNRIFFTAVRVAIRNGFSHMLYLEADCRVGQPGWDQVMWNQFRNHKDPILFGGTTVSYNPCNSDRKSAVRHIQYASEFYDNMKIPMGTYGWKSAASNDGSLVYVNGALGIYDLSALSSLFDMVRTRTEADQSTAWDQEIGVRMWKKYGSDSYYLTGNLTSVFSSYGNVLSTQDERVNWLRQGRFVAVHQVKGKEVSSCETKTKKKPSLFD